MTPQANIEPGMTEDEARKIASSDEAFRLYVVSGVASLRTNMTSVLERQRLLEAETTAQGKAIAALQVKSGVWGFLSGLVAGVLAALGLKT